MSGKLRLSDALRRAQQHIAAACAARRPDLTLPQLTVMLALLNHGACSQTRLVEMTGIDRSTMAEMLRRLEREEVVRRERSDHDQRVVLVTLLTLGAKALRGAEKDLLAAEDAVLDMTARSDRPAFMRALLGVGTTPMPKKRRAR